MTQLQALPDASLKQLFTEARTVNGALQVTGLESDAELTTVNGAIHLEVGALASGGHLHLTTINGAIAVRLPAGANATVDATTINGGVECALPIRLTDEGGRHSLHGIIGTGGASLSATTVNGGIRLDPI